jgi:sugar phosphate permease
VLQVWYFFYFTSLVCIWPYINIYFRQNGLSNVQIGILAALRPWVSASASFVWSGIADRYSAHKIILISTLVASTIIRTSMAACATFAAFFVIAALGEFIAAPVGVIADATVVASCKRVSPKLTAA